MRLVNRFSVACVVLLMLPVLPTAGAQTLTQRLADLRFEEAVLRVGPNVLELGANRGAISGTGASDLRSCIDDFDCPDSSLAAASEGNGNQDVTGEEVRAFSSNLLIGLQLAGGQIEELRLALRDLARIDGRTGDGVEFDRILIENAEGPVSSTQPVFVSLAGRVAFSSVPDADSHTVRVLRGESDLELANRLIIEPQAGWVIPKDSIDPAELQRYHRAGRIEGSQSELEGDEPLTFRIEAKGGAAWTMWLLVAAGILLVAGLAAYLLAQQRRAKL